MLPNKGMILSRKTIFILQNHSISHGKWHSGKSQTIKTLVELAKELFHTLIIQVIQLMNHESVVVLKGRIVKDNNLKMIKPPFVGFEFIINSKIEFSYFNLLRITAKTDGKIYKIVPLVSSSFELSHNTYAYIIDKKQQWSTYEIPFKNLQIEKEKHMEGTDIRLENHLSRSKLLNLSILRENNDDEEFQLSVKNIQLVQDNKVSQLLEDYTLPYFYHSDSLRYQKIIETGHKDKVYSFQKKVRQESSYINNFYK